MYLNIMPVTKSSQDTTKPFEAMTREILNISDFCTVIDFY